MSGEVHAQAKVNRNWTGPELCYPGPHLEYQLQDAGGSHDAACRVPVCLMCTRDGMDPLYPAPTAACHDCACQTCALDQRCYTCVQRWLINNRPVGRSSDL